MGRENQRKWPNAPVGTRACLGNSGARHFFFVGPPSLDHTTMRMFCFSRRLFGRGSPLGLAKASIGLGSHFVFTNNMNAIEPIGEPPHFTGHALFGQRRNMNMIASRR